ncbi:MAG: UDP-3-O-[3-hydroxymyristoyl] N-acetylglucosamine deacetylase [Phycisphaerales bacterium]|nr:UDP-3-O-[3-hydroxymyristoyl] N-acetylglucosamine deacetylase [Phycisphaerales bacterium]
MVTTAATPSKTEQQQTVRSPVGLAGTGLFTGHAARLTILPAEPDTGIVFRRTDLPGRPEVPAHIDFAVEKPRRTCLQRAEASVEMVEHCLSALMGMGIDNAVVELEGPEVPAGDGSAAMFVEAIERSGVAAQPAPRKPLVVSQPVTVRDGPATVTAMPGEAAHAEYVYALDFGEGSPIAPQMHSLQLDTGVYARSIAPARTFSTLADAQAMRAAGLFAHVSPKDMLVIGPQGPVDNALRFPDEPVRHKMLDLIGDLALVGRPIRGRILAMRSGHALNQKLARALVDQAQAEALARPSSSAPAMDIKQILRLLPHRFPMVLIDRVLEIEDDKRAVGVKNVTFNEPFFQGHYPQSPIMPGVLIVEAMCQLAGLMMARTLNHTGKIAVLLTLDEVRLRKPVTPGDQLVMETEALRANSRMGEAQCRAFVAGELAAEARVKFLLVNPETGR